MSTKNVTIGILVVMTLVFGFLSFRTKDTVTRVETQTDNVGSLASPDIQSTYLKVGGVRSDYRSRSFAVGTSTGLGTTTPCSLLSPAATSSLAMWTAGITAGTGDITFSVSTSTTAFASSSPALILNKAVSANLYAGVAWYVGTSTGTTLLPGVLSTGDSSLIIAPSTWVNLRIATSTAITSGFRELAAMTGRCNARFDVF